MKNYIQRLFSEWKEHKTLIIGLDYDDTIKGWKLKDYDTMDRTLSLVRKAQELGTHIVIFTACAKGREPEIRKYCEAHGIKIASINTNPITLPFGNEGKIYANIFLDDRAGLNEALGILEETIKLYKNYLDESTTPYGLL